MNFYKCNNVSKNKKLMLPIAKNLWIIMYDIEPNIDWELKVKAQIQDDVIAKWIDFIASLAKIIWWVFTSSIKLETS